MRQSILNKIVSELYRYQEGHVVIHEDHAFIRMFGRIWSAQVDTLSMDHPTEWKRVCVDGMKSTIITPSMIKSRHVIYEEIMERDTPAQFPPRDLFF